MSITSATCRSLHRLQGDFLRDFLIPADHCDWHFLAFVVGVAESLEVDGVIDFPTAIFDQHVAGFESPLSPQGRGRPLRRISFRRVPAESPARRHNREEAGWYDLVPPCGCFHQDETLHIGRISLPRSQDGLRRRSVGRPTLGNVSVTHATSPRTSATAS